MENERWDVVVVGGGPAGLSAALMLGRARRRVLVVDAGSPRNRFAAHMHGVLGNEGLDPAELTARGRAEVERYGVQVVRDVVERVAAAHDGLGVTLTAGGEVAARALVVAAGLADELPAIPGLAERWGVSVLHCPYCHGWEVRDQRLGVLVTSPQGLHQAELVRQWSDRVTAFTAGIGELEPDVARRLRSRGVEVVEGPVLEVVGETPAISAVRTADGREVPVDAMFAAPVPRPNDGFLAGLDLERTSGPTGDVLQVDELGRTTHERIWAVGNVAQPWANVPMSIGTGSLVGAAVNAALVSLEFDAAVSAATVPDAAVVSDDDVVPAAFWEERYAGADRVWSERPNDAVVGVTGGLAAGRALDLGCGEGADAIWLARQGWTVTGLDISATAVRRATQAARDTGLGPERVRFVAADLDSWSDDETYDLVTASFLQSPVALARTDVLRRAAERVVSGGHLLVVSHAAPPPWAGASARHAHHRFVTPDDELEGLAPDPAEWVTVMAEVRSRPAIGPDGEEAALDDSVVLLRRK